MDDSSAPSSGGRSRGKLVSLLDAYDLHSLGDELEEQWTRTDGERSSIRDLVDYVNRRLLERAMVRAGLSPIPGEVDSLYSTLSTETESDAERTRVRRQLERQGVDVESLTADFVSRQSVYTYLTNDRDLSYEREAPDPQTDIDTIARLRSRLHSVTIDRIKRLDTTDAIHISDPAVIVDVRVYCEACGDEFAVSDLTENFQCECYD